MNNLTYQESSIFNGKTPDILSPLQSQIGPASPSVIDISTEERKAIKEAALYLLKKFGHYENAAYINNLHRYSYQLLPNRVSVALTQLGYDFSFNQYGAIVFRGLADVDQMELGPTPQNWRGMDSKKLMLYGFMCSLLHGAVPSKPVQYFVQRKGGGLMHAIIPDEKMSHTQTGSGSKTDLFIHTEDAFLYNPADFLSFLYLRNEERVNSTLYSIRSHGMLDDSFAPLFKPIFKCPKDANFSSQEAVSTQDFSPVLYGEKSAPFIRFDAAEQIYNPQANQSPEAKAFLVDFWEKAKKHIYDQFIPESGDLVFVNNHLCAHGRTAFQAGIRFENGKATKCERRLMLRMMSKTSLIHIRQVTHPANPYLIMEDHYGHVSTFPDTNKQQS